MKRLKEKLKSRDGASLILSLLVLLLCIMVAATVLAAAVSNAGKAKSARAEQQRYQTLSSAVRLICGELEKVEYKGKYKVSTWTIGGTEYFYCEQQKSEKIKMPDSYGSPSFNLADFAFMGDGALNKEMDEIFRRQFRKSDGSAADGYKPLEDADVTSTAQTVRLTVALPDGLPGYPSGSMSSGKYEIPKKVQVKIELDHSSGSSAGNIKLTAWLDDNDASASPPSDGSRIMVAVLKPVSIPKPEITDSPSPPATPPPPPIAGNYGEIPAAATERTKETEGVTWKLDQVKMTAP